MRESALQNIKVYLRGKNEVSETEGGELTEEQADRL